MSSVITLSFLVTIASQCISAVDVADDQTTQPLPLSAIEAMASVRHNHALQLQPSQGQASEPRRRTVGNGGKRRHRDSSKRWRERELEQRSRDDQEDGGKKEAAHWNNYGEREKVVKDRGQSYVKAVSWDREEVLKDKWGRKGGRSVEGHHKQGRRAEDKRRKETMGQGRWSVALEDTDDTVWPATGDLTWQQLQALHQL